MNGPVIGVLWGDFPWEAPPRKLGKLLSWGAVARNVTRALSSVGTVVPYISPAPGSSPEGHRTALASFLRSIDVLWADFYPGSAAALELRHELRLPCRALLFAGGTLPKGAEAMLFPRQGLVRPDDALLFTCRADQDIWHRLVRRSAVREWVLPCPVDETVFYQIARDLDPLWPHQRYLQPLEWEVLRRIDGVVSVGDIVDALVHDRSTADYPAAVAALWRLYVEGFVLFYQSMQSQAEESEGVKDEDYRRTGPAAGFPAAGPLHAGVGARAADARAHHGAG